MNDLAANTRALLAALDTYAKQSSREFTVVEHDYTLVITLPVQAPWLPVAVAAEAARKAVDAEKPDLFEEDDKADAVYHAPCGQCVHRLRPQAECRPCKHYIN